MYLIENNSEKIICFSSYEISRILWVFPTFCTSHLESHFSTSDQELLFQTAQTNKIKSLSTKSYCSVCRFSLHRKEACQYLVRNSRLIFRNVWELFPYKGQYQFFSFLPNRIPNLAFQIEVFYFREHGFLQLIAWFIGVLMEFINLIFQHYFIIHYYYNLFMQQILDAHICQAHFQVWGLNLALAVISLQVSIKEAVNIYSNAFYVGQRLYGEINARAKV